MKEKSNEQKEHFLRRIAAYGNRAEAKEIKGKVMADGKGLAKVVVTDGTAFALTSEDGSYMIDADEKAHFIYVVTPSGYMAPCNGGTPVFYKTLNENSHDFQLHRWGTVGAIRHDGSSRYTTARRERIPSA